MARKSTAKAAKRTGRPPSATSFHGAKTRKEIALADLREIELQKRRGVLVHAEDVGREWAGIMRAVRAAVLAVPARLHATHPDLSAAVLVALDAELRAALMALGTDVNAR